MFIKSIVRNWNGIAASRWRCQLNPLHCSIRETAGKIQRRDTPGEPTMQALSPACLQHRLTAEERRAFDEIGLLHIPNVLTPEQVEQGAALTERIHRAKLSEGFDPRKALFYPNFIPDDPFFLDLVDDERILPKVWGILGWNIYLYHAHLIVTPSNGDAPNDKTFGWHQDSGRVNVEVESHPRPRLSLKVAYFLSDTSEPGRGNFWVVPRSHLRDAIDRPADGSGQPQGAEPVLAKPGDAVFFDRRLWHAASPNWSDITRRVLFYGFGYRWLRTKDDMTVDHLWEDSSPIRRQLLGWSVNANGRSRPARRMFRCGHGCASTARRRRNNARGGERSGKRGRARPRPFIAPTCTARRSP